MELWIPFVLATAVILVIPGPTIILVVSQAMAYGPRAVAPLVAGVVLGDFTAMTLSLLGLGALLSASATLFTVVKWAGAVYLIYLGIRLWRRDPQHGSPHWGAKQRSARSLLGSSFIVTALNPKSIVFFVAFLPQFIDPLRPLVPQLLLLGGTFLFLAAVNATLYAVFAGKIRAHLRKTAVGTWCNRCGGSALIGAGILTAGMQRSS